MWHKMSDRNLYGLLAHLMGRPDKAKAEWDAAYPSGKRF
jgi:hypothetical protein